MTYAADKLYREVAYVAYHFHWSLDDLLDLEHPLRHRFVKEISRIAQAEAKGRKRGVAIEPVIAEGPVG